jgi:hypothetical protein
MFLLYFDAPDFEDDEFDEDGCWMILGEAHIRKRWQRWAASLPDGRFPKIRDLFVGGEVSDTEALCAEMEEASRLHLMPTPEQLAPARVSDFIEFLGPGHTEETAWIVRLDRRLYDKIMRT